MVATARSESQLRAVARINPHAISHNCCVLKGKLSGSTKLCCVVKADGYGHGAKATVDAAVAGGAQLAAVVSAQEAAQLRAAGYRGRLLIMGAVGSGYELELALTNNAEVVVWQEEFLTSLKRHLSASKTQQILALHIKLDTGMGRLGTRSQRLAYQLLNSEAEGLKAVGIMTHLATADEPDSDFTQQQLKDFDSLVKKAKRVYPHLEAHAANSAATLTLNSSHYDMVRCGIAVYGLDPFGINPENSGLIPALELTSYVALIKECQSGQSVGYGRNFIAKAATQIATVPIGYGDGYRRGLSNNAEVLINGRRYPVVGNVSMDNITVELGRDSGVKIGDAVTLIGTQQQERILTEELAERLNTINYEIVCGLNQRVKRVYREENPCPA